MKVRKFLLKILQGYGVDYERLDEVIKQVEELRDFLENIREGHGVDYEKLEELLEYF